jgi:hypothetical protein
MGLDSFTTWVVGLNPEYQHVCVFKHAPCDGPNPPVKDSYHDSYLKYADCNTIFRLPDWYRGRISLLANILESFYHCKYGLNAIDAY